MKPEKLQLNMYFNLFCAAWFFITVIYTEAGQSGWLFTQKCRRVDVVIEQDNSRLPKHYLKIKEAMSVCIQ